MAFQSSTVSIGDSTKKSDYDLLLNNTKALKDEAITLNGVKTFNDTPIFNNGIAVPILHMQDQKSSGTQGGTFTSGAWQKRDINTEVTNTITGASLSSNEITLPTGTYLFYLIATGFEIDSHVLRLYNISDASVEAIGISEYSTNGDGSTTHAVLRCRVTIGSAKVFRIEHRCATTKSQYGFGIPHSFGTEIFLDAYIEKVT